jgi:hypothetical protein
MLYVIALMLAVGMLAPCDAGPIRQSATVAVGETVALDVPFEAGRQATVTVTWQGRRIIELRVYDGDGNVTVGAGALGRSEAKLKIYRSGLFRVEVRNSGPFPAEVTVSTH